MAAAECVKFEYFGFCLQAEYSVAFASCSKCHGRKGRFDLGSPSCDVELSQLSGMKDDWHLKRWPCETPVSNLAELFGGREKVNALHTGKYLLRGYLISLNKILSKLLCTAFIPKWGWNELPNANTSCSTYVRLPSTNLNHNILSFFLMKYIPGN